MSALRTIFSRGRIKLLVALCIPVGIGWVFLYAQQQASREVDEYQKEQKANPTSERITVSNYELKEVDDSNQIRWQLLAKTGTIEPGAQAVALDEVKVEYFDGQTMKMRLISPHGEANESSHQVKLTAVGGKKVMAEGEKGKGTLLAEVVELDKKNQFTATGGVNIVSEVAKVTGRTATGVINKNGMSDFKIIGGTHASILVK
jgi:hypothetical protein